MGKSPSPAPVLPLPSTPLSEGLGVQLRAHSLLGAAEGLGCGPGAVWPRLAPCPLCPPCPRGSGQDWPYMAEVRPTMSPDVPCSVKSH